ncbi:Uncharacterised protein [Lacrimispora sphenoides]|uniref:C2H2-type domain-containing protein n=2 Tax=Lacrimispora sphenoides TaxID=29370 RepID=A0ABY1C2A0_9FIRM|nr:hypothetical protein [Lacrimispora sphenoides]SET56271.1 hypothetical protein SAMN02745906_0379 [[Clostridium] sphenoides JCM 1415]SUY49772.1 Uncharacterised protein [Lacrimispora sphenoides]
MSEQKVQCRLCEQFFDDLDMSEEHYPAHSVGNDDIIQLDFIKLADDFMGENKELNRKIGNAIRNGENLQSTAEEYFDNSLAEDLYPKGRTARTLCRKCNMFFGKYDEAYKKFFDEDGNPKKIKGFQEQTKLQIVKALYAKFLSIPETQGIKFDFLDFLRDPDAKKYNGEWRLYFVKRDYSTDPMGFKDIQTGKIDWNMDGKMLVFELSDEKFIFNLLNFEKHDAFEMNNIFDIMEKNYSLVVGCHDMSGGYHGQMMLKRAFSGMEMT